MKGVTGIYNGLREFKRGCWVLLVATMGYSGLLGDRGGYRELQGLQFVTTT